MCDVCVGVHRYGVNVYGCLCTCVCAYVCGSQCQPQEPSTLCFRGGGLYLDAL